MSPPPEQEVSAAELVGQLHDYALQTLLALRQDLDELESPDTETLERVRRNATTTIAQLREVVAGVRVPLAVLELEPALQALAADVAQRTGTAVDVQIEPAATPTDHDAILLALAREFVMNAGAHANATRIEVSVRRLLEAVELTVRDDGYGMAAGRRARAAAGGHAGLVMAAERVHEAGGTLDVDGAALGGGSRITATLPVPPAP